MKLLFDENLSPALVEILAEVYPETAHVRELGLKSAPDPEVWAQAASRGFTIIRKDAGFHHRSLLHGHPPKLIWASPRQRFNSRYRRNYSSQDASRS